MSNKNEKPQTKADAIRIVIQNNIGLTNKEIEEEVRHRFGMNVGHNEIVNTIGSMKDRKTFTLHSDHHIKNAKKYLSDVGDAGMAMKFLKIAERKI